MVLKTSDVNALGMFPERLDVARDLLRDHVESGRSPSVAAVVLRRGHVVLEEAFGTQAPDGPALTVDHVWPIASAGKPLTAATVLSLVEEGHLGVMQPVTDLVPELAGTNDDDVLIHHLLTHTAGWRSDMFGGRFAELVASGDWPTPPPDRDFLSYVFLHMALTPERLWAPGELMAYSNLNYALLGEIVRRLTGGTLDAAMRSRVFEPLGMHNSALIVDDDLIPHLVRRADHLPFGSAIGPWGVSFQDDMWRQSDAGESGIHMSPRDLARFGQAILQGGTLDGVRFLAPTTVKSMCIDQIPGLEAYWGEDRRIKQASWGYGFSVVGPARLPYFGGLQSTGSVGHPGAGGIDYWVDFDHELVIVLFEVITEISENLEPISGIANLFEQVITGAIL